MLKKLYMVFGIGVLAFYGMSTWLGWEIGNAGSHSRMGIPFFYSGFRGGK